MLEHINFWGMWFVHNWLDTLWLPISVLAVHPGQRLKALGYVILCIITLRLQVEIVETTGFKDGFTGLWHWPLIYRGYSVYGGFTLFYLLLSWFSPRTGGVIYLAASLSIFFMAFIVSTVVLII